MWSRISALLMAFSIAGSFGCPSGGGGAAVVVTFPGTTVTCPPGGLAFAPDATGATPRAVIKRIGQVDVLEVDVCVTCNGTALVGVPIQLDPSGDLKEIDPSKFGLQSKNTLAPGGCVKFPINLRNLPPGFDLSSIRGKDVVVTLNGTPPGPSQTVRIR